MKSESDMWYMLPCPCKTGGTTNRGISEKLQTNSHVPCKCRLIMDADQVACRLVSQGCELMCSMKCNKVKMQ